MDRIDDSPVGSTGILDPVNQTGSPIQTDLRKIDTINRPASLGDTPPSSDSGVHSLGEQWENMSTSSIDMESEQNERPTHGSAIGRHVSDNRVPPNTEKDEDINYSLTDCLLSEESDENSSIDIQQNGRKIQYHICNEENSSVNSGTDGGNSDIGDLADFSDDEVDPRYTPEMLEEIRRINEMGFRSDEDEYTPQWEHEFQQTIAVHVDISDIDFPDGEDSEIVDRRVRELMTARTESNTNFPSEDVSEFFGRLVTEPVTSRAGSDTDLPNDEHSEFFGRPVTDLVTAQAESYTDFPNGEHYEFVDRRVTEPVTSRTGSDKDISGDVGSKLFGRPVTDSVTAQAGSYTDFPNGEHSEFVDRRVTESVTAQAESNTNFASEEDSVFFGRPVMEPVTSRAGSDTDLPNDEHSDFFGRPVTDSVTAQAGSYTDFPNGEHYEFVDRRVTEPVTSRTGSDKDIFGDVGSKLFDRLVTESATAWAERDSHGPSDEYWKNSGRPVTEAMTEMAGNDANISGYDYSDVVKQIDRKSAMEWAENNARPAEQRAGCQVPGCQCDGRIAFMEWGSEDMTETDDSEYEDPVDRDNRLYVESCNCDLSEGMTPRTYIPPLRRNRRRRYEVRKKYETDIEDSICGTIDDGFLTDKESLNSEHMVQPRTVADNVNRTVRNRNNNRGRWSWPGSENDITSDEILICSTDRSRSRRRQGPVLKRTASV